MPEKTYDFVNKGLNLKIQQGALQPGQMLICTNIDSTKEGSVCPRAGSKRFTGDNGNIWLTPHTLAKMTLGKGDPGDPRYVGEQSNIWRVTGPYTTDAIVSTGLGLAVNPNARWEAAAYNSGTSGNPFMFFAHPVRMLKDDSTFTPLRRWGIPPPVISATATPSGSGGQVGDYLYAYTFRNPQTGAEGNPSALMVAPVTLSSQGATVTFWGADTDPITGDPALSGLGSIAIYRSGGAFGDALYRFVGYSDNPGYVTGVPISGTFTDTAADLDIAAAAEMEFDNDMPVTSSLPIPFVGNISSMTSVGSFTKIFMNGYPNYAFGLGLQSFFTPGTQVTIGTGTNQEIGTVFSVDATTGVTPHWIEVALQNSHSTGEQVSASALAGQSGDLICVYQDFVLVAGDLNNPHIVYMSKSGRPDAFPVIDLEDGNAHQLNVGSPSNPVMGITEFDGEVVCLNQQSIFVFIVLNGAMSPPQKTPSDRGMVAKHCYCRVNNEIWFLSYDGIYSWSGGEARLRSEAIHDIFNSTSTTIADQTYFQIDYTRLATFHMEYYDQEVWMDFFDVTGRLILLRYQLLYDRWLPAILTSTVPAGAIFGALLTERDTGRLIAGVQDNAIFNPGSGANGVGFLQQMEVGTSESWNTNEDDGDQILWNLQTGFFAPQEQTRLTQFNELVIEISNPTMGMGDFINFNLLYDYSTFIDSIDAFGVTAAMASGRRFLSFPLQRSGVDGSAVGKEAKVASLSITGLTVEHVEIYSWTLRFNPLQIPSRNTILDWQNLGTNNDKQLYVLDLEFDPKKQRITLYLDIIAGVQGQQIPAVQQIVIKPSVMTTLAAPVLSGDTALTLADGTNVFIGTVLEIDDSELVFVESNPGANPTVQRGYLGTPAIAHSFGTAIVTLGRVRQTIPIVDNVICKSVRLRTLVPDTDFEIFAWAFDPKEDYPPDIVYFSTLTDNGSPYLKYVNQVVLDVDTNDQTVQVNLELDGAVAFTFPVNTNRFTRYTNITCPPDLAGVNIRILPTLPLPDGAKFQLWSAQYVTEPADRGPVTHSYDWDDLGNRNDKQLRGISFEYDGSAGDIDFTIDELVGLGGGIIHSGGITFSLTANTRGSQTFAFPDGHIAKMIRVRPTSIPAMPLTFKSWKYVVDKIDYPPDYVLWTDLVDNGSAYVKYVNQVVLEVDTGGIAVTVQLELDGVVRFTFQITATRLTRRQQVVCPPQLDGINMRILVVSPLPAGAKFQLWSVSFVTEPADRAAVTHSYDWDRINWPYDKKLKSITFEYDGSVGDVDMKCELLLGINGITIGTPLIFHLLGSTRALQQFGFQDDTIVKMIRLSPVNAPALAFKSWRYTVDADNYPPDFVYFTDKNTFGYACEKIARNLILDIDTGGVTASVDLLADGAVMQAGIQVNTTVDDRSRIIALNSNLIGREWYLHITPGTGGKSQLFSWNLDNIKEPCAVDFMDTYEQRFGYPGFKWVKMVWLAYACPSPITFIMFVDYDRPFFQVTLPAHPFRDIERFYLPAIDVSNQILNKSRCYRFQIRIATQDEIAAAIPYDYLHLPAGAV